MHIKTIEKGREITREEEMPVIDIQRFRRGPNVHDGRTFLASPIPGAKSGELHEKEKIRKLKQTPDEI